MLIKKSDCGVSRLIIGAFNIFGCDSALFAAGVLRDHELHQVAVLVADSAKRGVDELQ